MINKEQKSLLIEMADRSRHDEQSATYWKLALEKSLLRPDMKEKFSKVADCQEEISAISHDIARFKLEIMQNPSINDGVLRKVYEFCIKRGPEDILSCKTRREIADLLGCDESEVFVAGNVTRSSVDQFIRVPARIAYLTGLIARLQKRLDELETALPKLMAETEKT